MGRLFSPSGIGNLVEQVRTANDDPEVGTTRGVTAGGDPAPVASSGSQDTDRPLSILGIVNVGGQAGDEAGWAGVLSLLALVNIFLGLINLVPLLPFDGGHIAVACYEGVRSRIAGRPYRVDMAKLMPVTYVVFVVMVGLFVSTLYLDAVDPISIR
jgi:membrane-associated protease RseP (regulator of RpoE activity)